MKLWGTETDKALTNFGGGVLPREIVRAYGEVKQAALEAVWKLEKRWNDEVHRALLSALKEVIRGDHDGSFPLSLLQGGAGTSIHLNLNEVLSALTEQKCGILLDPLEDLARHQSTNDTFASAVTIAALRGLRQVENLVIRLQEGLVANEKKYDGCLMTGRTELQDALPLGVGQLFGSWAGMVERDRWRLSKLAERVREVPLGGTALGTCFDAPREYVNEAVRGLRILTGLPLARSQNLPDAVAHKDALAELASGYSLAAGNLITICDDLLFYTSSAVGEIRHPELQWASSIMPVKVNPVLLEFSKGLALGVCSAAESVRVFARESRLQLNAYLPFLAEALLRAEETLLRSLKGLIRFLDEMRLDLPRMERNLAASPALLNALLPRVGYLRLKTLTEAFIADPPPDLDAFRLRAGELLGIDPAKLAEWLRPEALTGYLTTIAQGEQEAQA